jgi:hypothetical protein
MSNARSQSVNPSSASLNSAEIDAYYASSEGKQALKDKYQAKLNARKNK